MQGFWRNAWTCHDVDSAADKGRRKSMIVLLRKHVRKDSAAHEGSSHCVYRQEECGFWCMRSLPHTTHHPPVFYDCCSDARWRVACLKMLSSVSALADSLFPISLLPIPYSLLPMTHLIVGRHLDSSRTLHQI